MVLDGLVDVLNANTGAGMDGGGRLNVRVRVDGGRVGTNASSGNGNGSRSGGVVKRKTRVTKRSTSHAERKTRVAEGSSSQTVVAESSKSIVAEETTVGQGILGGSSSDQNHHDNLYTAKERQLKLIFLLKK